jgi:hypothetical protein
MPYINIEFIFDDKSVKTSFTSTDESDIQSKITQIAWQLGTDI